MRVFVIKYSNFKHDGICDSSILRIYEDEQEALVDLRKLLEINDGYFYYVDSHTIIPRKTLEVKGYEWVWI